MRTDDLTFTTAPARMALSANGENSVKITGKTAAELFDCVRTLAQSGDLAPGALLPPARELARQLGVNRNTVASAYQRLAKAGIAVTQGRLGTAISASRRAGEQEGVSAGTALIDLADGNPNPRWLADVTTLIPLELPRHFLYGEDTILPALRQLAHDWLSPDCPAGVAVELTHGAVDAIERLASAHMVHGDRVAVEEPCFLGTINALRLAGMQTVGVEIDAWGMQPDALAAALEKGVTAVLITPRAHNPTGCSLSKRRAATLRRVLTRYPHVLIIVDDHFALLAETPYYSAIPASAQRWALVRSVSKGLGPDLRVAVVGTDAATAERLRTRLAPGMTWVSHILQALVAACLASPDVRDRLAVASREYTRLRNEMRDALQANGIALPSAADGFNVWIPLSMDEKDVAYALARKGWLVRLGNAFDVQGRAQAIRVTVSKLAEGQAERFARDLRACVAPPG